MEFPHLGQHCSEPSCKQLDFLPVKCDACQKIFCTEHYAYIQHSCPEAYKKDKQVPVCPLCNTPVVCKNGETPDVVVGRHIDNDCQSDTARDRRKVYTRACTVKGCKQKEVIPVTCERCRQNFCLRHRHEMDHQCRGFEDSGRAISTVGAAAVARSQADKKMAQSPPQRTALADVGKDLDRERRERQANNRVVAANTVQPTSTQQTYIHNTLQPTISEDEAMRRAIALSLQQDPQATPSSDERRLQEEADAALARALQESERDVPLVSLLSSY